MNVKNLLLKVAIVGSLFLGAGMQTTWASQATAPNAQGGILAVNAAVNNGGAGPNVPTETGACNCTASPVSLLANTATPALNGASKGTGPTSK